MAEEDEKIAVGNFKVDYANLVVKVLLYVINFVINGAVGNVFIVNCVNSVVKQVYIFLEVGSDPFLGFSNVSVLVVH